MKTYISLLLATLCTGCITTPVYDNNEYQLLAQLEVSAHRTVENCTSENISALLYNAEMFHTYVGYFPNNNELQEISSIIHDDVLQLHHQFEINKGTDVYCKFKTTNILTKIQQTTKAVAKKRGM